jgi:P-type Ca2+ transporter type 2C
MEAYQKTVQEILTALDVNEQTGLTQAQIKERVQKHGLNKLQEIPEDSLLTIFVRQFKSPLIYVLVIAAGIIFFLEKATLDLIVISIVIIVNAIIGTIQEGRARNMLRSLKRFIKDEAIVLRDGKKEVVTAAGLVPGDIIELQEGSRIPADARLIVSHSLKVEEAALTGESHPILKITAAINAPLALADRTNMVYKGTLVVAGSGTAVVVATGSHTQLGKINLSVQEIHTDMPLVKEIKRICYWIIITVFASCSLLFTIGIAQGRGFKELLLLLSALFVSAIPEGLPLVVTLVLATGIYRLAQKNVLIKKMHAVEGLGRVPVIAIDKTGTLTRNEMMVCAVCSNTASWRVTGEGYFDQGDCIVISGDTQSQEECTTHLAQIGIAALFASNADVFYNEQTGLFDVKGDPTEAALLIFAQKLGLSRENMNKQYQKLYEIPFNSELRYHAVLVKEDNTGMLYSAGSPEFIIQSARTVSQSATDCLNSMLDTGLRMVALAQKPISLETWNRISPDDESAQRAFLEEQVQSNCTFLAFLGIEDAIRPEVPPIIKKVRDVGIKVIMITGDHKRTASAVAHRVGILRDADSVIEGPEFEKMNEMQRLKNLETATVYARFTPHQKYEVVKLFHKKHMLIAMTGDGINDAPSLLAADLGIAMGKIGTEVAKEAADILLLDDSFVNIVNAIEEGRHIFYTLQRVITYLFSTNGAEVMMIFIALACNLPLPLTAVQIIWLNLVTDGFLDMGIAMEPKENDLLAQKKWLNGSLRVIDTHMAFFMVYMALAMAIMSLLMFYYYIPYGITLARTMTLVTLAFFQWFNAWNCRSLKKSIFTLNPFANLWFLCALALVFVLQVAILQIPFFHPFFNTTSLTGLQWLSAFGCASGIILWVELYKYISRK